MDLEFQNEINENYSSCSLNKWNSWQNRIIEPAFNLNRYEEMIKNFGYVSIEKHDFIEQERIYKTISENKKFDLETKKFFAFMAGTGFFKKYDISFEKWLEIKNWTNPYKKEAAQKQSINELIQYENGDLCIKLNLLEIPYWKR